MNAAGVPATVLTASHHPLRTGPPRPRHFNPIVCAMVTGATVLVLAACGGGSAPKNAAPPVSAAAGNRSAGTSAAPNASGQLAKQEIAWISTAEYQINQLFAALGQAPSSGGLTSAEARTEADALHQCSTGLTDLATVPTSRLQPVYDLFKTACGLLDQAAGCYLTLSSFPDTIRPQDVRKVTEASNCASTAVMDGATKLTQILTNLNQIKLAAGYL